MGFLIRWAVAFLLLAATFNPTQLNFVQWARTNYGDQLPLTALFGVLLFIGYVIYFRATLRSIGAFGMMLVATLVIVLLWVLYDWGWLALEDSNFNTWIGIVALSFILGVGLSWSFVRRALSGQFDVDETDE